MSLTTRQLSFHYQAGEPVLHDLSLDFTRGRVIGILGANGCGKSTLFMNLLGVLKPQQGQVLWNGEPLKYDKKKPAPAATTDFHGISGSGSADFLYRYHE